MTQSPLIAITGQVSSKFKKDLPTRQFGFQETDVKSIYETVTKYSVLVTDPKNIRYELEKSYHIANTGRKGPVLLDIAEDVLFSYVEEDELKPFKSEQKLHIPRIEKNKLISLKNLLSNSKQPVLVLGAGACNASNEDIVKMAEKFEIPILLTWVHSIYQVI